MEKVAHITGVRSVVNRPCSTVPQHRALWAGDKQTFRGPLSCPHFELGGKVLGLVGGSGTIGSKTAEIARALGMKVLVYSRSARSCDLWDAVALEDLLAKSDFVSVHCPLNDATRHLIDAKALAQMKPTAYLINTARGAIIKEDDLVDALRSGTIAGAGLDVQDPEPPADNSPLYSMDNVLLTPHIGWKRLETRQRLMDIVADNISAFVSGSPVNLVGQ